ncbi:MAG TPA: glycosyltransferase [Pyrinomonadaceae bacterium]|jgi:glycosyltransferase involved in cell wall biosynthesis
MATGGARRPTFSILLPTHNRADVLPFAVASVLAQTCGDFELLVVGDGCTDATAEVVASFRDARLRWFDLPKAPGFGYANRNVALREARGDLVAFMAHDDLWLADHLELLARGLERGGAEIAYSRPLWVVPVGLLAPLVFNLHHPETLSRFVGRTFNSIPAGCVVHRRECFDKYGYWDASLPAAADLDLWARIVEGGGRKNFAYVPEPTCLHFRANWRKEADVAQPGLHVWKALHAVEGFMPGALKLDVPAGMTEQEACWLAMSAEPSRWAAELRDAVWSVIEKRVALSDELLLRLGVEGGSGGLSAERLFESYAQIERLARLADELVEDSVGWKLLRRTRAALEALAPPDTLRARSLRRAKMVFGRAPRGGA